MSTVVVAPARSISGALVVPGDKSISHRYAILAALAEGKSEIAHFSAAADCRSTLECLRRLGVKWHGSGETVTIEGVGLRGLRAPRGGMFGGSAALDAENSGTTMRLLAGVLAAQPFASTLTGDESLRRRPMRRVIEPLAQMGAQISARDGGFAPLEIRGGRLRGIDYAMPVASAQVKSALLLAGLYADGTTRVTEPARTRDHTELALAEFGVEVARDGLSVAVTPPQRLVARNPIVPGDLSSAVFFLAAALILPGSNLMLSGVGLNPTRAAVLDVLAGWGATPRLINVTEAHGELVGDIVIAHAPLRGGIIAGATIPLVIDELPTLAALGPYTENGVEIRDAAELRVKESDRIATIAENLRRIGARVEEFPDGLRVAGRSAGRLRGGAEIDPRGDHRIAMAMAVAALGAETETRIRDVECARVSFPDFFKLLETLVDR